MGDVNLVPRAFPLVIWNQGKSPGKEVGASPGNEISNTRFSYFCGFSIGMGLRSAAPRAAVELRYQGIQCKDIYSIIPYSLNVTFLLYFDIALTAHNLTNLLKKDKRSLQCALSISHVLLKLTHS